MRCISILRQGVLLISKLSHIFAKMAGILGESYRISGCIIPSCDEDDDSDEIKSNSAGTLR